MLILTHALRSLAVVPIVALMLGASALHASTVQSKRFEIPFAFSIQKRQLPAGEYRVEQRSDSGFAALVNMRTGETVQVIRPQAVREEGKTKLYFETNKGSHTLRRIS